VRERFFGADTDSGDRASSSLPGVQEMQIRLSPEQESFVTSLVAKGQFDTPEAVISQGIRLIAMQEQLKQDVAAGVADVEAGRVHDHDSVFSDLRAQAGQVNHR